MSRHMLIACLAASALCCVRFAPDDGLQGGGGAPPSDDTLTGTGDDTLTGTGDDTLTGTGDDTLTGGEPAKDAPDVELPPADAAPPELGVSDAGYVPGAVSQVEAGTPLQSPADPSA